MSRINALQISSMPSGAVLTPQQKRFNTLIRQIEQVRQTLTAWKDNVAAYRQADAEVLLPLQDQLIAARKQWVHALDALLDQHKWTKTERASLVELLCDAAGELLRAEEKEDLTLKAVFDKHAEVDFDTEQRENMLAMKDMTEAWTGLDLGDDEEIHTHEDLMARMRQGLEDRATANDGGPGKNSTPKRKTKAQLNRETEAQLAKQSVREIYRKLASALHPDRETDAQQREEKTALMQQVNQAYAADDLLALLELQLRIEQIDASHIVHASAERLKHYNKVLSEQLAELKVEVDRLEMGFRMEFGFPPGAVINPHQLGELLDRTRRHWNADLHEQQRDILMLSDAAATKRWLKRQRQLLREAEDRFDFYPF